MTNVKWDVPLEYELVLVDATTHNRDNEETITSILHEFYKAVIGDDDPLAFDYLHDPRSATW